MRVFVIGHISPDLDAISSAVAYAEFLTKSDSYNGIEIIPVRAGEPNRETKYIFKKFGVEIPKHIEEFNIEEDDVFILVDHNEGRQRHNLIPENQIVEVNDHHRIDVSFVDPVKMDVKPFGATSTLIYEHFGIYGVKASKKIEAILLSSILSDTQGLKSATTTETDVKTSKEIAESLELNMDKLTIEIFKQKANFDHMHPIDLVKRDYKVYGFGTKEVLINQIETVNPESIIDIKKELLPALEEAKSEIKVDFGFIILTDILNGNSKIIYSTDEEKKVVEKAFITKGHENMADIGSRMSRKKEIAPAIEKTLLETSKAYKRKPY